MYIQVLEHCRLYTLLARESVTTKEDSNQEGTQSTFSIIKLLCTHGTKMILLFGITKNSLVTNRIVFVGYV
jgi:hypothetical protein